MHPAVVVAVLTACGGRSEPVCPSAETVLATEGERTLTCGEVASVQDWVELVAARSITDRQEELLRGDFSRRFSGDAEATDTAVAALAADLERLRGLAGPPAMQARAEVVWNGLQGETPLGDAESTSVDVLTKAVAPWARDSETQLVLSEMDVEGWLKYASLCREVQGGSPLTLSVADRVILYKDIADAFEAADRSGQLALLSIGPAWPSLQERWPGVTYEVQQAWVEAAPLPGPMTATSLGYASTVMESDLSAHATALHAAMGQLPLGVAR